MEELQNPSSSSENKMDIVIEAPLHTEKEARKENDAPNRSKKRSNSSSVKDKTTKQNHAKKRKNLPRRIYKPGERRDNPFNIIKDGSDTSFKFWSILNGKDAAFLHKVGVTRFSRINMSMNADILTSGTGRKYDFARALCKRTAVARKEFFETYEFFARIRNQIKCTEESGTLVEVAGGHGLLSALFALFTTRFRKIIIIDRKKPASHEKILESLREVCDYAADKITFVKGDFSEKSVEKGSAVVAVHGCNSLTDLVLNAAITGQAHSAAVMPCCYANCQSVQNAPKTIAKHLGVAYAADIQRTYYMEQAGYVVNWKHIPSLITPMNRILLCTTPKQKGKKKKEEEKAIAV
eukprot:g2995.t1